MDGLIPGLLQPLPIPPHGEEGNFVEIVAVYFIIVHSLWLFCYLFFSQAGIVQIFTPCLVRCADVDIECTRWYGLENSINHSGRGKEIFHTPIVFFLPSIKHSSKCLFLAPPPSVLYWYCPAVPHSYSKGWDVPFQFTCWGGILTLSFMAC